MKKNTIKSLRLFCQALCIACVAIFLFGCATVTMKSVRDPSFSEPINKLFIILNHGQIDRIDSSYTPYLITALRDEFSKMDVEIAIRNVNALVLDESIYRSEITSYEPDGVMTIIATGGMVAGATGGLAQIIYDVSLFDSSRNKRIWRAHINASGGTAVREKRMKLMAKDLVKGLSDEKLISSEPRPKGKQL